jgi:inorganic pyrophosphatase
MSHQPPRLLTQLPAFREDGKNLNVIIETSKGSRNKFDYEPDLGAFELSAVLPEGMVFPYDFGFVPSTLGEDGDPLDVLVLMDESAPAGALISARLIGVIEADQTEADGKTSRNPRLLAVASRAHTHGDVQNLDDLRPKMVEEIEHFFASYNETKGRVFRARARSGPSRAIEIVREGMQRLQSSHKPD